MHAQGCVASKWGARRAAADCCQTEQRRSRTPCTLRQPMGPESLAAPLTGTLKVYKLKQHGSGAPQALVQGRLEQAVVKTADGLFVNIANVNELKRQGRLPDGWGWDAQVTVTGRT